MSESGGPRLDRSGEAVQSDIARRDGVSGWRVSARRTRSLYRWRWVADVLACAASGALSELLYHALVYDMLGQPGRGLVFGAATGLMTVLLMALRGGYAAGVPLVQERVMLAKSWAWVVLSTLVLAFLVKVSEDLARGVTLVHAVLGCAGLFAVRAGLVRLGAVASTAAAGVRTIVVGPLDGLNDDALPEGLRSEDMRIIGAFEDVSILEPGAHTGEAASEAERFQRLMLSGGAQQVIVTVPWTDPGRLHGLMAHLATFGVPVRVCLGPVPFVPTNAHFEVRDGWAMVEAQNGPSGLSTQLKRGVDYVGAGLGLLLCAPLLALVAVAIRVETPGPVFFRQRRHGRDHQVFWIYKFRSMTVLEDGLVIPQAKRNDRRVTRVGRFLRRTSLDELPQLINVLRGEMSLVGPRPHALAHNHYYASRVPRYAERHRVLPGITGWAQVNGFRGETRSDADMAERVRHDLWYVAHRSLLLDIRILLKTVVAVVFSRNAY